MQRRRRSWLWYVAFPPRFPLTSCRCSLLSSPFLLLQAISTLLDFFPHLSSSFLRSCLLHPSVSSSPSASTAETTEKVVAALLEDSLPSDLVRLRDGISEPVPVTVSAPIATPSAKGEVEQPQKRFDTSAFTQGRLLGSKDRRPPPFGAAQLQLDESLKASIIALAEAPSSDEEEEDEGGEAFLEDDGGAERAVRVGDGEAKEEGDEEEVEGGVAQGDGPQGGGTSVGSVRFRFPSSSSAVTETDLLPAPWSLRLCPPFLALSSPRSPRPPPAPPYQRIKTPPCSSFSNRTTSRTRRCSTATRRREGPRGGRS